MIYCSLFDRWETMERTFFPTPAPSFEQITLPEPKRKFLQLHEVEGEALKVSLLIRCHLGKKLYDEFVRIIDIAGRTFIHVGEIHGQKIFEDLQGKLTIWALKKKFILFDEGIVRNKEAEIAVCGGPDPGFNFGLEGALLPVQRCVIYYSALIDFPKHVSFPAQELYAQIKTFSFSPQMVEIWPKILKEAETLPCKALAEEADKVVKEQIETSFDSFRFEFFQLLYWVMAKHALSILKLTAVAKRAVDHWVGLPPCLKPVPEVVLKELYWDQREPVWAHNVAAALSELPKLPVVSIIGKDHLEGYTDELLKVVRPHLNTKIRLP